MKLILILLLSVNIFAAKEKLDKKTTSSLVKALEQNEQLHLAYFSYDAKSVQDNAKKVNTILNSIKAKEVKLNIKKATSYLEKINAKASQDDNNKYYHLASVYLIKIINKYDLGPKYQPYYCPMVRKKWIQNIDKKLKVHNPYDSSMPHCGGRL